MNINNEINNPQNISLFDIKTMTQDFDIIKFYKECQDCLAVMMITQHQVVVAYWKISDENGTHDKTVELLKKILTDNNENAIIAIRLGNENNYDLDSEEMRIESVFRVLNMGVIENKEPITSKMIAVVEKLLDKIRDFDVLHDELDDLIKTIHYIGESTGDKPRTIIGLPIDDFILKLEEQSET